MSTSAAPSPSAADRVAALQRSRAESNATTLAPPTELRGAPDLAVHRNPTMWLAVATVVLWALGFGGYLGGWLSGWVATPLLAVANYFGFTVFHESVHRTAHTDRRINDWIGVPPSLMLTFTYPVFRICHLKHHANTNDPEFDPDHSVALGSWITRPFALLFTLVNYRRLYYRHHWERSRGERVRQQVYDVVLVAMIPAATLFGFATELWVLYWAPVLIAGLFLFYAFDYLPHHPHESTERFHDTRIQPGRLRHAILLGQNHHLIHHLWVSVPWFRYRRVYEELESELRTEGIRVG